MIKININDIWDDFIKTYSKDCKNLTTYAVSSDLCVLGNSFSYFNKTFYSLSFSLGTYITVSPQDDGIFTFRTSYSNEEFISKKEELMSFFDNKLAKDVFNTIGRSKTRLYGAKILFNFDAKPSYFHKIVLCTEVAFSDNSEELLNGNNIFNFFGQKNYLCASDNDEKIRYIPFDLTGYKIVIISFLKDIKKTEKRIKKMAEEYKNKEGILFEIADEHIKAEEKLIDEKKRTSDIKSFLEGSFSNAVRISEKIFNDPQNMSLLIKKIEATKLCDGIIPSLKYHGVAVFIKDENVDEFIYNFSKDAEKITGTSVAFYITECQNPHQKFENYQHNL